MSLRHAILNLRLDGRTAMVTGGGGDGLGRGYCLAFAEMGANVVIANRRLESAQPVIDEIRAAGGTAMAVVADAGDRRQVASAIEQTVDWFGGLDIMVHNALGEVLPLRYRLEEITLDQWAPTSRSALWGSHHTAQLSYPHLRRSAHGRLILVSSSAGVEGSPNIPIYSAVKAAQRALVKSLAREWGAQGITVNAIAPVAMTGIHRTAMDAHPIRAQRMKDRTALGEIGDERDVAAVVAFLASDAASYITGQTIVCDGGGFVGL